MERFGLVCGCNVEVRSSGTLCRSLCNRCSIDELEGGEPGLPGLSAKRLAEAARGREEEIGEALGWPMEDIEDACSGRRPLDLDEVREWARLCGRSMASLFDGAFITLSYE